MTNLSNISETANLQVFNSPEFGEVRTIQINSEPYFVGRDIASALGYAKPENAIAQHIDNEDTLKQGIPDSQGFSQITTLINESGVYSLIFGSKLPTAKQFKKWVTSEVLPTIRKTGGYIVSQTNDTPEEIMARALIVAQDTIRRTQAEKELIAEQHRLVEDQLKLSAPKIKYHDKVLSSVTTYNANQIAKELGTSAVTLNRRLQDMGVQYKQGGQWLLYSKYQNKGYTETRTVPYTKSDGTTGTELQTRWTEEGRKFIHKLLNN